MNALRTSSISVISGTRLLLSLFIGMCDGLFLVVLIALVWLVYLGEYICLYII